VLGVALDGIDQVRDQVDTTLQLNGNVAPGFVGPLVKPHQTVVHEYNDNND
jgi:hypothetical protein